MLIKLVSIFTATGFIKPSYKKRNVLSEADSLEHGNYYTIGSIFLFFPWQKQFPYFYY